MNIQCYHNIHKDQEVKGFLDYQYCSELEDVIQYNVYRVLENNYIDDIEYICIYAHGSRVFGNPRKDSDIDFVLFYKGSIREDDLFNIFVDESIFIEHIKCDFNPIRIIDDSDIEYYIQKHDVEYYQKPLSEKLYNLRFALDDFEPEEVQLSKPKQENTITKEDSLYKNIKFRENFVDLGLPSGTLWRKYNLGAFEGKYAFSWYGNYYAWGETQPKEEYSWKTYKFGEGEKSLTKYCNDDSYGKKTIDETSPWGFWRYKDDLTQLLPEDDVVTQLYRSKHFHIPNEDECNELLKYCTYKWKTDYNGIDGLNGYILVSNINHKMIFIPAAGVYQTYGLQHKGSVAWFWSSTLYYGSAARMVTANNVEVNLFLHDKYVGVPVRAVYN